MAKSKSAPLNDTGGNDTDLMIISEVQEAVVRINFGPANRELRAAPSKQHPSAQDIGNLEL